MLDQFAIIIPSLHHSICDNNIDICAVSETWIKQDDDHTQMELAPPGYKVLSYPQSDGHVGGGLAFILKDYLKVTDPTENTNRNPSHNPEASVNKSLHQISLQTAVSKCTKFPQ